MLAFCLSYFEDNVGNIQKCSHQHDRADRSLRLARPPATRSIAAIGRGQ